MFYLETLQYRQLLELVARFAQTPLGESRVLNLVPERELDSLQLELDIVAEAIVLDGKDITWSFSKITDPSDLLELLEIKNTSLEPVGLRLIAHILRQALSAGRLLQKQKDIAPNIARIADQISPELSKIVREIEQKILPSGEIDDSASSELKRLRSEINSHRQRITKNLEQLMRSKGSAVQDAIVTVRNGRFVIPIKAESVGKIKGVAHGTSSSGATIFLEPLDSIDSNNELQTLRAKEQREIARILFALTESLRGKLDDIENAVAAVAEFDFVKAKLGFARRFDAIVPEISSDGVFSLVNGRHPLLEESLNASEVDQEDSEDREIVPISFSLTQKESAMIISGANAGGKTVILKTAGLLSLMAISGLPVPADTAGIPLYSSILADIGDHQSLAANLSTFSSHVSNIASMVENLKLPALVLLDEVGTGTDPDEGSALGVAIVDHFRKRGAQLIASTHYKGLKIYAAGDKSVINASVEFDEKTLQPTYKLLTGLAGASSGFEIARRFGIGDSIIEVARENLDASALKTTDYLRDLQNETRIARDLRIALEEERRATAEEFARLDVKFRKKDRKRSEKFEAELDKIETEFKRESSAILKEIKESKEQKRKEEDIVRKTKALRQGIRSGTIKADTAARPPAKKSEFTPSAKAPAVGLNVLLKALGKTGRVERIDGENADVTVGSIRMRQKISDLQVVTLGEPEKASRLERLRKSASESPVQSELSGVAVELNLLGMDTYDAKVALDAFLDQSSFSKLHRVRVIHGFGTGALKTAVHQLLKGHVHVASFTFAPQNEGGNGATIVELKK